MADFKFTPIADFQSSITKSVYVRGLNYTVRDIDIGEKVIDASETPLGKLVAEWVKEGKVRIGTAPVLGGEGGKARLRGKGKVT